MKSKKEYADTILKAKFFKKHSTKTVDQPKMLKAVPDKIDWRKLNAVTPVKDQGVMGSSAIFAGVAVIESFNAISTGKLNVLSENNVVDCSDRDGEDVRDTFTYVAYNGGIDTQAGYPGNGNGTCRYNSSTSGAHIDGWMVAPNAGETYLKSVVGTYFPVSIGYDASSEKFQFYTGGVYIDDDCSENSLDHDMLIVGYDSVNGKQLKRVI